MFWACVRLKVKILSVHDKSLPSGCLFFDSGAANSSCPAGGTHAAPLSIRGQFGSAQETEIYAR